jgi:hypothetical protein
MSTSKSKLQCCHYAKSFKPLILKLKVDTITCTHTPYTIHCTHTLYSYTVLIHCTPYTIHHTPYTINTVLKVDTHRNVGADISFVSMFPAEEEYLYPPLTHLKPVGEADLIGKDKNVIGRLVTVVPSFPNIDLAESGPNQGYAVSI